MINLINFYRRKVHQALVSGGIKRIHYVGVVAAAPTTSKNRNVLNVDIQRRKCDHVGLNFIFINDTSS